MKSRRSLTRKLRCEALEGRLVLSAIPGWSVAPIPPLGHSQVAAAVAKVAAKLAPISTVSSNWSGYAVTAAANSVSYVAGTWTVPTATTSGYSSVWVGIDGYSSQTVAQIGTEADYSSHGTATYYAWYEMFPADSMPINSMTVKPGDSITASVAYNASNSKYTLTITDTTETTSSFNDSFSIAMAAPGMARSSAEWVVEAPSSGYGVLPLANFGSVTFTNAYATINGTTGAIDNWQGYAINMQSRSTVVSTTGGLTDTTASSLPTGTASTYSGNVSSFSVKYTGASTVTPTPTPTPKPTPTPAPSPTPAPNPTPPRPWWAGGGGGGWGGWGRWW